MISYTLILTTAIFATSQNPVISPGASISTTHIPGFATLDDCETAGRDARIPSDRKYYETDKVWSCAKIG